MDIPEDPCLIHQHLGGHSSQLKEIYLLSIELKDCLLIIRDPVNCRSLASQ